MAGGTTSNGQSAGGAAQPLADCWVTLAALEGDSDERAHVHDMVRQAGGHIFDAKRVNLVADAARAYAVCPLSFPPERLAEAARQPDFRLGACALVLPGITRLPILPCCSCLRTGEEVYVQLCWPSLAACKILLDSYMFHPAYALISAPKAEHRCVSLQCQRPGGVTPYWVELSIEVGSPVAQLGRDRVTCKPLPYPLPPARHGGRQVRALISNMSCHLQRLMACIAVLVHATLSSGVYPGMEHRRCSGWACHQAC